MTIEFIGKYFSQFFNRIFFIGSFKIGIVPCVFGTFEDPGTHTFFILIRMGYESAVNRSFKKISKCIERFCRTQPNEFVFFKFDLGSELLREFFTNWAIDPIASYDICRIFKL